YLCRPDVGPLSRLRRGLRAGCVDLPAPGPPGGYRGVLVEHIALCEKSGACPEVAYLACHRHHAQDAFGCELLSVRILAIGEKSNDHIANLVEGRRCSGLALEPARMSCLLHGPAHVARSR